jgi:hypothetical protein
MNEADFDTLKRDWQEKRELAKEASRSAGDAYRAFRDAGGTKKGVKKTGRRKPASLGTCSPGYTTCRLPATIRVGKSVWCRRHYRLGVREIAYPLAHAEMERLHVKSDGLIHMTQREYSVLLKPILQKYVEQVSAEWPMPPRHPDPHDSLQALEEENREHVRRLCAPAVSA